MTERATRSRSSTAADQDEDRGDQHDVQKRPSASRISATRSAARGGRRRTQEASAKNLRPAIYADQMDRLSRAYPTTDLRTGMRCGRCARSIVARRSGCDRYRRCAIHVRTTAPRLVCDRAQSKVSSFRPLTRNDGWRKPARPATLTIATTHSFAGPAAPPSSPRQRLSTTRPPAPSALSAASRTSPASATARSAASTWSAQAQRTQRHRTRS